MRSSRSRQCSRRLSSLTQRSPARCVNATISEQRQDQRERKDSGVTIRVSDSPSTLITMLA